MVSKRASIDLGSALAAAQADLDAARIRQQDLAAGELIAAEENDDTYLAWARQKRIADAKVARLIELVAKAQADIAADRTRRERSEYAARYNAVTDRNAEVSKLFRTELPRAWSIISAVLEAAALAEIATAEIIREMPADFEPEVNSWIGDPDRSVRCRPPSQEEVLGMKVVELWVDPKTGNRFADQSQQPTVSASRKAFREISYQAFRPAGDTPPFYRGLKMPRLDTIGGDFLFDGSTLQTPYDVLAALRKTRERRETSSPVLTRIEPLDRRRQPTRPDLGPPTIE